VRNAERERLRHDVHALLEYDWERGAGRRFVAVERAFGEPDPVALPAGDGVLFLRGRIDRLDVDGNRTLVRDFKTGRPWPRRGRQAAPDPARDVQLALYGLVAERLAPAWGLPARVAAAYAYVGPGADERAFRHDFDDVLAPAAREWLQVAAGLLTGRLFPRTPDPGDCRWCPFRPVCGSEVHDRARRLLLAAEGPLARFAALRRPVAPGGPEAEAQEDEA
jgi:RecB family exonuclease